MCNRQYSPYFKDKNGKQASVFDTEDFLFNSCKLPFKPPLQMTLKTVPKILLERADFFCNGKDNKINMQKSMAFLNANTKIKKRRG